MTVRVRIQNMDEAPARSIRVCVRDYVRAPGASIAAPVEGSWLVLEPGETSDFHIHSMRDLVIEETGFARKETP